MVFRFSFFVFVLRFSFGSPEKKGSFGRRFAIGPLHVYAVEIEGTKP